MKVAFIALVSGQVVAFLLVALRRVPPSLAESPDRDRLLTARVIRAYLIAAGAAIAIIVIYLRRLIGRLTCVGEGQALALGRPRQLRLSR